MTPEGIGLSGGIPLDGPQEKGPDGHSVDAFTRPVRGGTRRLPAGSARHARRRSGPSRRRAGARCPPARRRAGNTPRSPGPKAAAAGSTRRAGGALPTGRRRAPRAPPAPPVPARVRGRPRRPDASSGHRRTGRRTATRRPGRAPAHDARTRVASAPPDGGAPRPRSPHRPGEASTCRAARTRTVDRAISTGPHTWPPTGAGGSAHADGGRCPCGMQRETTGPGAPGAPQFPPLFRPMAAASGRWVHRTATAPTTSRNSPRSR